ncbi:glycerate kinase [Candidatus Collinsella stercoripullorum]|uniref:glycerate kinase family protein n=1 Tax=Candidatus Collinsella stercoripullorum TaxID=2838522 RepID=UPI0022E080AD|nr:glycerate kinase [Candidatus Collinsella stercoripullorum]
MDTLSVLIASDSFKGSVSSKDIADLLEQGIHRVSPGCEVRKFAIADGGEGTVEAVMSALGGQLMSVDVLDPLGDNVTAHYGMIGDDTAVIEMAEASGITLIEQTSENAGRASTWGVGQVMLDAVEHGAKRIYIGLGGSATSDGGAGMAKALGVRFLDSKGEDIPCGLIGLKELDSIDCSQMTHALDGIEIIAITDVTNPLTGPDGAVCVYGPQKGIPADAIAHMDGMMVRYARILKDTVGRDVDAVPGSGAAGGLGAALVAFCNAKIARGIDTVLDLIGLEDAMVGVDLVITGEGRMDAQSAFGKAPVGVARRAKHHGIPVVAVVGGRADDLGGVYDEGIDLVLSIATGPITLAESVEHADTLVPIAGENVVRTLLVGAKACARRLAF